MLEWWESKWKEGIVAESEKLKNVSELKNLKK